MDFSLNYNIVRFSFESRCTIHSESKVLIGKVGAIAVSGLATQEDHDLIVEALRKLQAKVNQA